MIRNDGIQRRVGERIRQVRLARGMSLAQLGGKDLSRGFLSAVELGRSHISLPALSVVAGRLGLPVSYFVDEAPPLTDALAEVTVDQAEAAIAYSLMLRSQGKTERALDYALWAAQSKIKDVDARA